MDEIDGVVTPEVTEEEEVVEIGEESIDDVKAELAKAKEIAENQRIRAEKAEKKAKEVPQTTEQLSVRDAVYLAKADIHDDDLEDVLTFSKKMGVTLREAHEHYKPILNERSEERKTARATQTNSPRGSAKTSGSDMLNKALNTGEVPDTDAGMLALAQARLEARRKK